MSFKRLNVAEYYFGCTLYTENLLLKLVKLCSGHSLAIMSQNCRANGLRLYFAILFIQLLFFE